MASGPIVIGFDGSPASEHAVHEAAGLLGTRPALVVVVWEAGTGFEMQEMPGADLAPAPIDFRAAKEIDDAMAEGAQKQAQHGAQLASNVGFEAEGLAVADEASVAETLVRVAEERDAQAIVVGAHGHSGLTERILGSTSEAVIRHAGRPVVVVRPAES